MRSACSDQTLQSRLSRQLSPELLRGRPLLIDGYDVLTTLEAALGGGVILAARDTCYRDMASIHGTYRKVEETLPAIALAGKVLAELGPSSCQWYLDSPVGNSGRLKGVLLEEAAAKGWNWQVDVVIDPDAILSRTEHTVATADSVILDRCQHWFNLASHVIQQTLPSVTVVQMTTKGERQDAEAAWRSY